MTGLLKVGGPKREDSSRAPTLVHWNTHLMSELLGFPCFGFALALTTGSKPPPLLSSSQGGLILCVSCTSGKFRICLLAHPTSLFCFVTSPDQVGDEDRVTYTHSESEGKDASETWGIHPENLFGLNSYSSG